MRNTIFLLLTIMSILSRLEILPSFVYLTNNKEMLLWNTGPVQFERPVRKEI